MSKLLTFVTLAIAYHQANAVVPLWGQCGGMNWTGETTCASGSTCVFSNPWYSQCLPSNQVPTTPTPTPTPTSTSSTSIYTPPITTTSTTPIPSSTTPAGPLATSLNGRFVNAGKLFWGSAADANTLNIASNEAILKQEFGQVTPENSMKWDSTEATRNTFTFTGADTLVNWATTNGKLIRGHTFVWHSQLPSWVSSITDKATLTLVIQSHIAQLGGRYRGKIYGWDVVNEIFNEDGTLRSSVFSNVFGGDSFVQVAFEAAREVDPAAKLYINDYNLDAPNAKANAVVAIVKKINGGTKLIDGIGTQMHLSAGAAGSTITAVQTLAGADVDVAITELDIVNASPVDYSIALQACILSPKCVSVTSWGVSDANSWRSDSSPLLFDKSYIPKPAYFALMEALPAYAPGGGPTTTATVTTPRPTTTVPPTTSTTSVTPTTSTAATPTGSSSPTGLHARFRAKGKKFWGTCADSNTLNIAANAAVLRSDFGQLTPENSMKWDATEANRGQFNFGGADTLVNWATSNGKLIRGHTFVWHSQLPGWVNNISDRATLTSVIENHIQQLGGRYAGKIYAWDVVNEMFNEDGTIRSSVFSRVFGGDGFVNVAFAAARRTDPNAVLYINDYNLDSANSKTNGMVNLVKKVNGGGTRLIDGCGTQMHLNANGAGGTAAAVNALAAADCEVAITELDIQQASANDYTTVLRACLNQPRCAAITSWGVSDTNSWRASTNPLLFNGSYQPKAAYTALINALA